MTMQKINQLQIIFLLSLIGFVSCSGEKKPKPDPNIPPAYAVTAEPKFVKQGELSFLSNSDVVASIDIELADTEAKRVQGMMHRRSMGLKQGMLFIFDREERQSFWMKNTHIALDIVFVNEAKEIVHIAPNCAPYSMRAIPSYEYAKFVVEVNSGYCKDKGIKVGDSISF